MPIASKQRPASPRPSKGARRPCRCHPVSVSGGTPGGKFTGRGLVAGRLPVRSRVVFPSSCFPEGEEHLPQQLVAWTMDQGRAVTQFVGFVTMDHEPRHAAKAEG